MSFSSKGLESWESEVEIPGFQLFCLLFSYWKTQQEQVYHRAYGSWYQLTLMVQDKEIFCHHLQPVEGTPGADVTFYQSQLEETLARTYKISMDILPNKMDISDQEEKMISETGIQLCKLQQRLGENERAELCKDYYFPLEKVNEKLDQCKAKLDASCQEEYETLQKKRDSCQNMILDVKKTTLMDMKILQHRINEIKDCKCGNCGVINSNCMCLHTDYRIRVHDFMTHKNELEEATKLAASLPMEMEVDKLLETIDNIIFYCSIDTDLQKKIINCLLTKIRELEMEIYEIETSSAWIETMELKKEKHHLDNKYQMIKDFYGRKIKYIQEKKEKINWVTYHVLRSRKAVSEEKIHDLMPPFYRLYLKYQSSFPDELPDFSEHPNSLVDAQCFFDPGFEDSKSDYLHFEEEDIQVIDESSGIYILRVFLGNKWQTYDYQEYRYQDEPQKIFQKDLGYKVQKDVYHHYMLAVKIRETYFYLGDSEMYINCWKHSQQLKNMELISPSYVEETVLIDEENSDVDTVCGDEETTEFDSDEFNDSDSEEEHPDDICDKFAGEEKESDTKEDYFEDETQGLVYVEE